MDIMQSAPNQDVVLGSEYPKLQPGDPAWTRVTLLRSQGHEACDAIDHNEPTGCSNPDCWKHPKRKDR